jgi:hypothetical protein
MHRFAQALVVAFATTVLLPLLAEARERELTPADRQVVDSLKVGGFPWGATKRLRAIALSEGGGTPADRNRVETLARGGSLHRPTSVERKAAAALIRQRRGW